MGRIPKRRRQGQISENVGRATAVEADVSSGVQALGRGLGAIEDSRRAALERDYQQEANHQLKMFHNQKKFEQRTEEVDPEFIGPVEKASDKFDQDGQKLLTKLVKDAPSGRLADQISANGNRFIESNSAIMRMDDEVKLLGKINDNLVKRINEKAGNVRIHGSSLDDVLDLVEDAKADIQVTADAGNLLPKDASRLKENGTFKIAEQKKEQVLESGNISEIEQYKKVLQGKDKKYGKVVEDVPSEIKADWIAQLDKQIKEVKVGSKASATRRHKDIIATLYDPFSEGVDPVEVRKHAFAVQSLYEPDIAFEMMKEIEFASKAHSQLKGVDLKRPLSVLMAEAKGLRASVDVGEGVATRTERDDFTRKYESALKEAHENYKKDPLANDGPDIVKSVFNQLKSGMTHDEARTMTNIDRDNAVNNLNAFASGGPASADMFVQMANQLKESAGSAWPARMVELEKGGADPRVGLVMSLENPVVQRQAFLLLEKDNIKQAKESYTESKKTLNENINDLFKDEAAVLGMSDSTGSNLKMLNIKKQLVRTASMIENEEDPGIAYKKYIEPYFSFVNNSKAGIVVKNKARRDVVEKNINDLGSIEGLRAFGVKAPKRFVEEVRAKEAAKDKDRGEWNNFLKAARSLHPALGLIPDSPSKEPLTPEQIDDLFIVQNADNIKWTHKDGFGSVSPIMEARTGAFRIQNEKGPISVTVEDLENSSSDVMAMGDAQVVISGQVEEVQKKIAKERKKKIKELSSRIQLGGF